LLEADFPFAITAIACSAASLLLLFGWLLRKFQREIRISELTRARWAALLDRSPVAVWTRKPDHHLAYVNPAYARASGGADASSVLAEQRELGRGQLGMDGRSLARRVLRTGGEQTESISVVADGRRRLLQVTEYLLADGYIAGFAEDLTALDDAQAELASHIASHQEVLEQLRAGIAVFDADRRLRFFNRAYADMWGLDREWLTKGPTLSLILETLRENRRLPEVVDFGAFRRQLDQRFQKLIETREELLHLPDARCFREICAPHPLGGLLFVFEDVTDRLALERSYNTLIDVQRDILDRLADGIAAFGTNALLTVFNPAFRQLTYGDSDPPKSGDHFTTVLARIGRLARNQAEWEKFREAAQQAVNTREIVRQRIFFRDGRVLNAVLAPLADGSALMSIRDITDTFNVERVLLERNAALEEANRLKTDFLANASYELRTPLTTISGFAELLSNAVGGPVTAQQQEYLDGILRASETLAALIDSILDISFAEAGQLDINSGDIAIAPLLNSVAEVVRPQIASKGIELAIESAPSLGSVQADERRLRQLVFNLLSSAARLSTANSVITVFAHGNATFIFLEARVATTLGDGTLRALESELSLTLVQRLTELHGGRVEVASDDNQAVSIRCLLVRKRAMPDQSQRASAA